MNDLKNLYPSIKNNDFTGCYLTLDVFLQTLGQNDSHLKKQWIGQSEEGRDIFSYTWGRGPKRILMWSQMHGDEPTTTKALLDLFNYLNDNSARFLEDKVTLYMIPILNPDGAYNYTRVNANGVDLNRDAQNKTQKESRLLLEIYEQFKPDYCFNLHQQPTVYGVRNLKAPSVLSFLTPSTNEKKEINPQREKSMRVISDIYKNINPMIINRISRYNDNFNLNCFGDTFQSLGTPTLLFEAGYEHGDRAREQIRELMFYSMVKGIESVANENNHTTGTGNYFDIPDAEKCFYDIIIRNVALQQENGSIQNLDLVIQYKEVLKDTKIVFIPIIEKLEVLDSVYHGHIDIEYSLNKPIYYSEIQISKEILNKNILSLIEIPIV